MSALVAAANVTLTELEDGGYLIAKQSGGSAWNGSAISVAPAPGDFVLRMKPMQGNRNVAAGVSAEPAGMASATLDYGFYFRSSGLLQQFQGGVAVSSSQPGYGAEEIFWLVREGGTIRFLSGPELESAVLLSESGPVTGPLSFDSAFFTIGSAIEARFEVVLPPGEGPRPRCGASLGLGLCL
jgi:hypothetical protein